ncbi:hypothetical protein [Aquitalea magnusonii]|uniref:hypothetical protein n=1 Tax=Aquitalea magnusonii TaxID=332411 RepID=UPI00075034B9|nr:hypothetical protein [Aquitalea magnusonii]
MVLRLSLLLTALFVLFGALAPQQLADTTAALLSDTIVALSLARLEAHYFVHRIFLPVKASQPGVLLAV